MTGQSLHDLTVAWLCICISATLPVLTCSWPSGHPSLTPQVHSCFADIFFPPIASLCSTFCVCDFSPFCSELKRQLHWAVFFGHLAQSGHPLLLNPMSVWFISFIDFFKAVIYSYLQFFRYWFSFLHRTEALETAETAPAFLLFFPSALMSPLCFSDWRIYTATVCGRNGHISVGGRLRAIEAITVAGESLNPSVSDPKSSTFSVIIQRLVCICFTSCLKRKPSQFICWILFCFVKAYTGQLDFRVSVRPQCEYSVLAYVLQRR